MRTVKANQEEEDYVEDDFTSKREGPSSNKDVKENDKASAMRSKHSVTEQRRRSKINERFQTLRALIPNSEQKRDTASFLLEVIDYVQYLQEKVQKHEGTYPGWTQEPTKLTPWRNNHWRVQPVGISNGSTTSVIPFPGKFEETTMVSSPSLIADMQNSVESDQGLPLLQGDEYHVTSDGLGQSNNDLVIEGGTINISAVYSNELLCSLTQALQNAGIDLSQAKLSVQIDLGKRANHDGQSSQNLLSSDIEGTTEEESEHSLKRVRTL